MISRGWRVCGERHFGGVVLLGRSRRQGDHGGGPTAHSRGGLDTSSLTPRLEGHSRCWAQLNIKCQHPL